MRPVVAVRVNEGSAINCAMLTLIPSPTRMATKRFRYGCPPFDGPSRVIVIGSMCLAGDFATDGPVQIDGGWWTRGRLLLFNEERASVYGKRVRLRKVRRSYGVPRLDASARVYGSFFV